MHWLKKLNQHKFLAHSLAFGAMLLPTVGLYYAAQSQAKGWIFALLGLVILGNLLELGLE